MSIVTQIIVNADNELRYPTIGELEVLSDYLKSGEERIKIITSIKEKEQLIVQNASKAIFTIYPEYIAPGGNAEGARKRSLCLRDYSWYLRLITYGVLSGDKETIENIGIIGVREMYNSLGVPIIGMIDGIECLKKASLDILDDDDAAIIAPYFDFITTGMS